ncbi:MAG: right-handed parallel beta-helix repeat-containing protein, partial [Planctomycetaceae bacterium]|nr:right-handed parallel beta-helix repeat-containing protein [Planctomycetaceae bacterium]
DTNTKREKGQLTLYGNSITYSSDYAIKLAPGDNPVAAARQQTDFRSGSTLIPGIAVTNNVLAFNEGGGISIEGLVNAIPFVRIVNNTFYGSFDAAIGTGILLGSNTAATIMNNIFANLDVGVALNGANGSEMVYRANTYQGNRLNGPGTGAGTGPGSSIANLAQELRIDEPLFVNAKNGNFYPAPGSKIIDSATQRLEERRQWYLATLLNLGIPESAIIAPEYDMYGQLRSYDETTSGAGTGGENPGLDRGAIDRVDFIKPTAALANPEFRIDGEKMDVTIIAQRISRFAIQLSDTGTGIDRLSVANAFGFVHEHVVTVYEDLWSGTEWIRTTLVPNSDYFADYNAANGQITLTPTRGQWRIDARYVIVLNDVASLAIKGSDERNIDGLDALLETLAAANAPQNIRNLIDAARQSILDLQGTTQNPLSVDPQKVIDALKKLTADLNLETASVHRTTAINGVQAILKELETFGICDIAGNLLTANRASGATGFTIGFIGYNYSDAPASYSNYSIPSTSQDGPSHIVYPYYQLGQGISIDSNPRPSLNADGSPFDDGVKLKNSSLIAGSTNTILVQITDLNEEILAKRGNSNIVGYLSVWFDWDGAGSFTAGAVDNLYYHQIEITKELLAKADADGYIEISVTAPSAKRDGKEIEEGNVFARFRFSSEKDLTPTGPAPDGEVEDYVFGMVKQLHPPVASLVFFDAEDGIKGFNELENGYVNMGNSWLVIADSNDNPEVNKLQVTVTNTSGKAAYLYAWIKDDDGKWVQILDKDNKGIMVHSGTGATTVTRDFTITLPNGTTPGKREIRFRLTTDATLEVNQFASDGNFVDMTVDVIDKRRSFGNAPGNGNTLAKDGGASHLIVRGGNGNSQLALGTKAIETRDGQPARNTDDFGNLATGNDGLGDCVLVIRGAMSYIEVIVTNTTSKDAYLNIWVDLNNTFLFDDHPAKHIVVDEVIPAGTPAGTVVTIDVTGKIPGSIITQISGQTVMQTIVPGEAFLRMRLSDQLGIGPRGAMGPDGRELKGEVEDHVVKLLDHGATISGYVFKDVVGNGTYGPMNQAVPTSDVVVRMGTTVPFSLGGTEAGYTSAGQATGISNSVQLLPFAVRVGGRTYDGFVVTDKGAVMLVDWMSAYGYYQIINGQIVYVTPSIGAPSLYSGNNPTFAPFLSNMTSAAEVSYVTGVDEDGRNFVKFLWDDD